MFTGRTHRTQQVVVFAAMTNYRKRIQSKTRKGKRGGAAADRGEFGVCHQAKEGVPLELFSVTCKVSAAA